MLLNGRIYDEMLTRGVIKNPKSEPDPVPVWNVGVASQCSEQATLTFGISLPASRAPPHVSDCHTCLTEPTRDVRQGANACVSVAPPCGEGW